ncbi:MAG: hypothetical protein HY754_02525 [Nitrospirae bacterium]|nr:hypothetical protein [Nitrospirota bacterium]
MNGSKKETGLLLSLPSLYKYYLCPNTVFIEAEELGELKRIPDIIGNFFKLSNSPLFVNNVGGIKVRNIDIANQAG